MYIEAVPNRNSPPAILLRESYREDGKIKKRTLLNLTDWPTELVEGFRTLLKGGKASPVAEEAIIVHRSFPHGHVAAALGALRKTGLDRVLGPAGNRCRDLVMAMVVMRLLSPASKLATARMLDAATPSTSSWRGSRTRRRRRERTLYRPRLARRASGACRESARPQATVSNTAFFGLRLWDGGEAYLNPEIDQGYGLQGTLGVAGFTSAEAYKAGHARPYMRFQRYFIRQTIGLGGESETIDPGQNSARRRDGRQPPDVHGRQIFPTRHFRRQPICA